MLRPIGTDGAAQIEKPKTEKPYRTARGVSHGMAERPQRHFDSPPVTGLDPKLASELGLTHDSDADYVPSLGSAASAEALKGAPADP